MTNWLKTIGGPKGVTLRVVLLIICVYHLGVGLSSTLAPESTLRFAQSFYGLDVSDSAAQFTYMLKAMGMYALFTGGLLALALRDPKRYRHIVVAAAVLLLMRAVTRLLFFDLLEQAFGLAWQQNLINVTFLVSKGALLLWTSHALEHSPEPGPVPQPEPVPLPLRTVGLMGSASRRLAAASQRLTRPRPTWESASGVRL
jgi:hypothetical protein